MSSKASVKNTAKKAGRLNEDESFFSGNYALMPICAVIFFVTLLMRAYVYMPNMEDQAWFPLNQQSVDIFLYYKGIVAVVLAGVMVAIFVAMLVMGKIKIDFKKDIFIYPLAGFALLAIISTVLSKYRYFGVHGMYEQFETIWVLLAYCIFTFFTFAVVNRTQDLRVVRKALLYLLVVLCFIGFTQLVGKDFFESPTGRTVIVPESLASLRNNLTFNFSGSGNHQVYLTLYNPNYVGLFVSFMLPITITLAISAESIVKKIVWGLVSISLFVLVFGSGSKSFILAFAGVAVFALIFFRKQLLKKWPVILGVGAVAVVAGLLYFNYVGVNIFSYMGNALKMTKNDYKLTDADVQEGGVVFTYGGNKLVFNFEKVDMEDGQTGAYMIFSDESGTILDLESREDGQYLTDPRFEGVSSRLMTANDPYQVAAMISFGDVSKYLSFVKDETGYHYYSIAGKVDEIVNAPSAIFTDYDGMASGRGYIWSRTIPVMMKHFFIGTGADTFAIAFPHNDYVGRLNSGYGNLIITKPHCMYLQIGTQLGVVALLCFLALTIILIVDSFKLYWKFDATNPTEVFGIGITLGVIGYLISGVANDSCVSTAPIFWIFVGLGYAVNKIVKKQREESSVSAN